MKNCICLCRTQKNFTRFLRHDIVFIPHPSIYIQTSSIAIAYNFHWYGISHFKHLDTRQTHLESFQINIGFKSLKCSLEQTLSSMWYGWYSNWLVDYVGCFVLLRLVESFKGRLAGMFRRNWKRLLVAPRTCWREDGSRARAVRGMTTTLR